jgi:hypothetical protein
MYLFICHTHQHFQILHSHSLPPPPFVCFVPLSRTEAIISLNSINRLVFVMDTQCVYCEVGIYIIYISVLQTGYRKGCQGFRETKMRNRGRILMAALNLYELQFVWPHSTLTIPSLTARRQSIAASVQQLPHSAVRSFSQSVSTTRHRQLICQAHRSV